MLYLRLLAKTNLRLFAGFSEAIFAVCPMETVKVKFIHDMNQGKIESLPSDKP